MVAERPTDGSDARSRIDRFFEGRGITPGEVRVVALTGDASDRQYFRAQARGEPTQVLAVHPRAIVFDELPFANVMRLLAAMPVPAPRVLGHSDALGIIALEDLGDVTLQTTGGERVRSLAAAGADPVLRFLALLEPVSASKRARADEQPVPPVPADADGVRRGAA
jgi:aminoglycoside/choline kinase family phosphotransferase